MLLTDLGGVVDPAARHPVPGDARVVAEVALEHLRDSELHAAVEDADAVRDLDGAVHVRPHDLRRRSPTDLKKRIGVCCVILICYAKISKLKMESNTNFCYFCYLNFANFCNFQQYSKQ